MRRFLLSSITTIVLTASILAPASSSAAGEAHPLIRRAMNALAAAKNDLQNAAHDYCGHRVQALAACNAGMSQLQQALACDARRGSSYSSVSDVEPESSAASRGERHPNINKAISALGAAESDLQNAAHDYCGHRVEALEAVRAALNELKAAIACDKQ